MGVCASCAPTEQNCCSSAGDVAPIEAAIITNIMVPDSQYGHSIIWVIIEAPAVVEGWRFQGLRSFRLGIETGA